jgi:hypothetical protein
VPNFNPGCAMPGLGSPVMGRFRYSKTIKQFGGAARPGITGSRNFAVPVSGSPPCHHVFSPPCVAGIVDDALPATLALGATFGFSQVNPPVANPSGLIPVGVTGAGSITSVGAPLGAFSGLARTSFGGPWTTGSLTVSVTWPGLLTNSIVMLSGTDLRSPAGSGVISLVSGSVVRRTLGGLHFDNEIDFGTMTLMVPEPGAGLGAGAAAVVLGLCHAFVSRRRLGGRVGG